MHVARTGRVVVLGSVNVDLVIRGPRLPLPGETILGGEFYRGPGGKGANQAVAAARASRASVAFVAAVGDDEFGRAALDGFRREGLETSAIKVVAGSATGVALILVDDHGQNMISVASGANLELLPEDVEQLPDALFSGADVVLASLESPRTTVQRFLERARAAGCLTILNPAPAITEFAAKGLLTCADLVTPNEREAAMLAEVEVRDVATALVAARRLQELGCRSVIVTRGQRGCLVVDQTVTSVAALPVRAVDSTAAGDAFSGALAVALAERRSLAEAVEFATRAAARSVMRRGAQASLPTRDEIDAASG